MRKNLKPIKLILIVLAIIFLSPQIAFSKIGVLKKIKKIGEFTSNLAVDSVNNKIYVANIRPNNVVVIDGDTDKKIDKITIPGSQAIDRVGFDSNTNKLYIVSQLSGDGNDVINVLDGSTRQTLTTINLPIIVYSDLAINSATNKTYFIDFDGNTRVLNGATNEISFIPFIPVTASDIKVNSSNNKVYIGTNNDLFIIDGLTDTSLKVVHLSDSSDSRAVTKIAIDPIRNKVYVLVLDYTPDNSPEEIKIIDGDTDEIIDSFFIRDANSLAIDPNSNILYTTLNFNVNSSEPFLALVNLDSKKIIKNLSVKTYPSFEGNSTTEVGQIVVNPITHKAYVQVDYAGVVVVGDR